VSGPGGVGANSTDPPQAPLVTTRAADTAVVQEGAGRRVKAGQHDEWARAMSADANPENRLAPSRLERATCEPTEIARPIGRSRRTQRFTLRWGFRFEVLEEAA
jgi:hypothetical protein